ncbi:MAG TPA: Gfo/Idh/MocA family oxidoreductase, partial [Streptosporangiaceae bacterium]
MTSPLRVGIIGCGNAGYRIHLPTWLAHRDLARVVALADPTPPALSAAGDRADLSAAQLHADPFELIARGDIDAVDICTPQHVHCDLLIAAAKVGKHVLCEKPLGTAPADAAAGVTAAAEHGITLAMAHNYLWLPEIQAARRVIGSGEIGDVRAVIINFLGVVDVPGSAAYRPDWRHRAGMSGGGVLMDMLHGVYLAEALLGQHVRRSSGYVNATSPGTDVEDIALCRFETDRNAALVNIGWGLGPGGIEITGSAGRISVRYQGGGTAPWAPLEQVLITSASGTHSELSAHSNNSTPHNIPAPIIDSFHGVITDFVSAVTD